MCVHGADIIAKYNSPCAGQPGEGLPSGLCENAAKSSKGVRWEEESSPTRCKLLEETVAGSSPPGDSPATTAGVTVLWLPQDTWKEQSGRCCHEESQTDNPAPKATRGSTKHLLAVS